MFRRFAALAVWLAAFGPALAETDSESIDFANQVRPILSDACFACHGPDEESRAADLRLDDPESAAAVIESGDASSSELYARLVESDPELKMPPPDSGKQLDAAQIAILKRWIDQGAEFETHWAFVAPSRPQPPRVGPSDWVKNPIDAFVARTLESEGLFPSPVADHRTLIRRLSLDLTGLPPEPAFVTAWLKRLENDGESAYQDLVGVLLQSSHYGEHWARMWLDAARYADSDGYEKDKPRQAWFYRDWVVDSFNHDRPYDDFLVRQIAGDLLPGATQADHVATGFLRNSMVNEEGGADPEQFRMEAMFDRMDAIGKSILGLTIQCAQCHTHKYDPIEQHEYYGMFAFLNNTHDAIIPVYTDGEQNRRDQVLKQIADQERLIKTAIPDWRERMHAWASDVTARDQPDWTPIELSFLDRTLGGSKFLPQEDRSYLCQSYAPTNFNPQGTGTYHRNRLTGLRLELLTHPNLPRSGPGRSVDGTWALSELTAEVALSLSPDQTTRVKFNRAVADRSPPVAELKPRYDNKKSQKRVTGGIDFAIDGDETTAWTNEVDTPQSNISQTAWFEFESPIEIPDGQHAIVTVHLAQRHGGWNSDDNQTFNIGRFRVSLTGDAIPEFDPLPPAVDSIVRRPPAQWSPDDEAAVFAHWRTTVPEAERYNAAIDQAWKSHPLGTTQLTLGRRDTPRTTSLLARGDFLSPVEPVTPHVPAFLHQLKTDDAPPRLQFARWLASDESPTTARSIVNRIWQAYFGVGLVETSDDLGTQSAPPSHPELMDFLAVELVDNGWSLKHLHRLIVSSATYRQSSRLTPELSGRDPYNRLLARGARFRVPAETVRDITLAASGLLNRSIGGPSVYPPAPEFLFKPPVSYGPKVWEVAEDAQRYRRALYTFRFRSVPYPMLENFDAVPGNLSCVRRSMSNTPMQALTSLNEPMFLEAAIALAAKTIREVAETGDDARIRFAFQRCVGRAPSADERRVLADYLHGQRTRLESQSLSADQILSSGALLEVGDLEADELAAWSLLCRVILNLDETITRE
ncbi:Planctomycete cytochrome C [Stieleria maiorica]|uniref:Planctomycete cytochrome C n=1 Tax=Stieleria maiorica TaxID=2795974 RepID=A0A5B9M7B7_9BACT|nr:PSD1 and planctomycete cytochrome C domain-containing protein [Stieleria maiorica]QEF97051.1 Planctomycete cytochrome C [Stieleria maiorica]